MFLVATYLPFYPCLFLFFFTFLSPHSAYFGVLSNFLARFSRLVCIYIYIYIYIYIHIYTALMRPRRPKQYCLQLHIYIYIYICMYVYMYIYIYMYVTDDIYIYILTNKFFNLPLICKSMLFLVF